MTSWPTSHSSPPARQPADRVAAEAGRARLECALAAIRDQPGLSNSQLVQLVGIDDEEFEGPKRELRDSGAVQRRPPEAARGPWGSNRWYASVADLRDHAETIWKREVVPARQARDVHGEVTCRLLAGGVEHVRQIVLQGFSTPHRDIVSAWISHQCNLSPRAATALMWSLGNPAADPTRTLSLLRTLSDEADGHCSAPGHDG